MSERSDDLSPEARRARDGVRALSRPQAEPSYRARLKQAFVAGTIPEPVRGGATGGGPAVPARRLPGWRSLPWAAALVPAAAALIVVTGLVLNRGPAWEVIGVSGEGLAVVDGRPIPVAHREDLGRALRPGTRLTLSSGATLEIGTRGQMVMQVAPSTDMTLPTSAGRWFAREVRAAIASGEVRITTGRGFRGATLHVATPEARVMVTGTTLAVIRETHGTCVCVMDGVVHVGGRSEPMVAVEAGRRRFVFNDGRAPEQDEMRPMERVKLGEFRAQHRARMGH